MATLADLQAELVEVKAAISKTLEAQAYTIGGGTARGVTRASLDVLYRRRSEIEIAINRLDSVTGGICHSPIVGSRR